MGKNVKMNQLRGDRELMENYKKKKRKKIKIKNE